VVLPLPRNPVSTATGARVVVLVSVIARPSTHHRGEQLLVEGIDRGRRQTVGRHPDMREALDQFGATGRAAKLQARAKIRELYAVLPQDEIDGIDPPLALGAARDFRSI
jgi:hypothetical protein